MKNIGDSVGICVVQDEKIVEINDCCLRILGYNLDKEVINSNFLDYIDNRDRYLFSSGLDFADSKSELWHPTIIRLTTRDKTAVSVSVRCIRNIYLGSNALILHIKKLNLPESIEFESEGDARQLLAELNEIIKNSVQQQRGFEITASLNEIINNKETDRLKIEHALMREKRLSEALTNSLPGILYLYDRDGKLLKWNKNLENVSGYDHREMAGMHFTTFIDGKDQGTAASAVKDVFFRGEQVVEAHLVSKTKKRRPYYFTGTRITLDNKDYLIGLGIDITEKKRLEAESMRAAHLASLGELAAGVAHEINNPIHGIINCAQIIIDQCEGTTNDTQIPQMIIKEGNRVAEIVKNLLSFARYQKESHVPVSIEEVIKDSVGLIKAQLSKEGIQLGIDIETYLPKVMGHPQEIQQVILNVISNARHALNSKAYAVAQVKRLEIKVDTVLDDGIIKYLRITFLDNGIGIPAEIMDKICDPFFSTKPRGAGSGLGLSISFRIIKDHNGYLNFKSVEGEYTKVIIHLPADEKVSNG